MAENPLETSEEQTPAKEGALDLNALSELDFGPSWADKPTKKSLVKKDESSRGASKKDNRFGDSSKRDRRSSFGDNQQKRTGFKRGDKTYQNREGHSGRSRSSSHMFYEPKVKVDIYPQDEAFEALIKRLRSTMRTYQLFEIVHLILEKPERYNVVVQNKAKKDEKPVPLYYSLPGYLPFESEEAAINHVLNNHLDQFFDIEEIEVEPPKGNFQMVNRCTVTGKLLGPPNDHRYQEFLQRHYTSKINGMSFDQFVSKIETLKDQESIDAWVESMKKGMRYTLKERKEGEPELLESFEAVRTFLMRNRREAIVGSGETVRFSGRDIEQLPQGTLRNAVETYIQQQIRFPLDTANNIRGRLRRHKFTIYKKGSKGISYVCAVRRKFRDSKTVFSPSIQSLIEFIEKNPNVLASELVKLHVGIDIQKQKPAKLEMGEDEATDKSAEPEEAKVESAGEENTTEVENADAEAVSSDDATVATDATPTVELNEAEKNQLKQLMLDLRWLISEGYVTEYGNGCLFAPPPMPETKQKVASEEIDKKASTESLAKETESEIQTDEKVSESADEVEESEILETEDT